ERATQSLRRMNILYTIVDYIIDIINQWVHIIPEDIYSCFILDYFLRGCEVLSSQELSESKRF
ncbi:MAG: hypothetical protein K2I94_08295, partial [Muribaculaceae bacterium]|nr:hypothetical protein [Muribaculaceae bacterium]